MAKDLVMVDRSDPVVAMLRLNRADRRNALSIDLMTSLTGAIKGLEADKRRRAFVLCGEGPAFCAGLDFKEAQDPANSHKSATALADLYRTICRSPLVSIAAAHGSAFGGGAGLLAACDFSLSTPDFQVGYPEVKRGLVAALVTCLLRRQVNGRRLREILILGQTLGASEACAAGLLNRVVAVPAGADGRKVLEDEARRLAGELVEAAPGAVARTKRLLDDLDGVEKDLAHALDLHLHARDAAEAAEGIAAFFEKRKPNWAK